MDEPLAAGQNMPGRRVCLVATIVLGASVALTGQTFEVGPQGSQPSHTAPKGKTTRRSPNSDAGMGWGSSIGVAREARAAREALQKNDYRSASAHAARARSEERRVGTGRRAPRAAACAEW